ncbi:ATP-binding cassette domain-containing protein [Sporomusa aerivorans]|uniref:ABC transporter ATP-binding protein n=1 Tax=Sporomusa aerivorans TaxID=204936 RepID=UPI00352A98F2
MPHGVVIELTGISKQYGQRQLFAGITERIQSGECWGVTGPNGSGKSTLLKIMAGIIRPSLGTVRVCSDSRELPVSERSACFGIVSPEIIFYRMLSGYENLEFITRAGGVDLSGRQLLDCLERVGLAQRRHDKIGVYSTGMLQRLKFAVLIAMRPLVWLLDEPSSNLDSGGRILVADLIKEAQSQQIAVVIATNEAEEVNRAQKTIALA